MRRILGFRVAGLLAAFFVFTLATQAQRGEWQYLGEANVDGQNDHDNITVTAAKGAYRAIQIRVERGPIEFERVLVHFGDGQTEPIAIRARIEAGGQTRVIPIAARERIIERVEFWYSRA